MHASTTGLSPGQAPAAARAGSPGFPDEQPSFRPTTAGGPEGFHQLTPSVSRSGATDERAPVAPGQLNP